MSNAILHGDPYSLGSSTGREKERGEKREREKTPGWVICQLFGFYQKKLPLINSPVEER